MNFFAALTCTIFAWGLAEGSKVFLRNFQSAGVSFHRTRRTHSNDRFGTNIRGCSGLRCTNQANGILQGVQLSQLHQQSRRHSCARLVHFLVGALETSAPLKLVHCLLGRCTPCSGKRQSRAETSAPLKYHRKTTNISEIIRNFAASIVESKLLEFLQH